MKNHASSTVVTTQTGQVGFFGGLFRFVMMVFLAIISFTSQVGEVKAQINPPPPPNFDNWYYGTPTFMGSYSTSAQGEWGYPMNTSSMPLTAFAKDAPHAGQQAMRLVQNDLRNYCQVYTIVKGYSQPNNAPVPRHISFWFKSSNLSVSAPVEVKLGNTVIATITANRSDWTMFIVEVPTSTITDLLLSFTCYKGTSRVGNYSEITIDAVHCETIFYDSLAVIPNSAFKISDGKVKWNLQVYGNYYYLQEKSALTGIWTDVNRQNVILNTNDWWYNYTIPNPQSGMHFYRLYQPN